MTKTPTGRTIRSVRATGYGSARYGVCEVCKKAASEIFFAKTYQERLGDDGITHISSVGGGVFGHRECVSTGTQS